MAAGIDSKRYYVFVRTTLKSIEQEQPSATIDATAAKVREICQEIIKKLSSAKPNDLVELCGKISVIARNFLTIKFQPPAVPSSVGVATEAAAGDFYFVRFRRVIGGEEYMPIKGKPEEARMTVQAVLCNSPGPDAETEQQKQARSYRLVEGADGSFLIAKREAAFDLVVQP